MSIRWRWSRGIVLPVALAAVLFAPLTASGQEPSLEIVEVTHAPDGLITVSLARTADGLDPLSVTALLDGAPIEVKAVDESRPDPTSVVIAMDTSGSMQGAPMASAQAAALALVERLDPADPVAIVGFAAQPALLADFTTDREATRAVLNGLVADGETALFDAVRLSSQLLSSAPTSGTRALVLLSDGEDSGSGEATADEGIELVTTNDIDVYAFALGNETDVAYLQRLATAGYWGVASEEALASLFTSLGSRLGATLRVDAVAPPLALGDHSLEVRGTLAGMPVSAQSTLTVTNEGLLAAETTANADGRLVIHLETSVPLGLLGVRGVVDGVEIRPTRDGDLFFDHWALSPGTHEVEITALVGGELIAQRTLTVDIPALEPELAVRADTEATPPIFHVSARVQRDAAESTIRVLIDGAVFEEGPADETLRLEGIEDATVELLGADGEPLLSESVRTLSSDGEEGGRNTWPMILLGLGVLGAAGGARALYRRPLRLTLRRPKAPPRPVRARPARRPVSVSTNRDTFGQLVLRTPEGEERTVQIGLKPLTVGSSAECDVVLDSPTIRPVHARVSARPNGEFQVHGVAQSHASPYLNDRHDEWAVLVSGESIAIGDHVITLLTAAETEEVDRAIFHN